jgi:uncharacterized protein (DUF3084 family)
VPIYSTQHDKDNEKAEILAEIVEKKIEEVAVHEAAFADEKKDHEEDEKVRDEDEKVREEEEKVHEEEEKVHEEVKKIEEEDEKVHEEEEKVHEEEKKVHEEEHKASEEIKVHDVEKEKKKLIEIETEHQCKEAVKKGSPIGQYIRTLSPSWSPTADPNFSHVNFWSLSIRVDEIDEIEELV